MKTYGKLEAKINAFITSTLDGLSYQLHAPATLAAEKEPRLDTPNGSSLGGAQTQRMGEISSAYRPACSRRV